MAAGSTIEWLGRPGTVPATLNPIRARNIATGKLGWYCTPASHGCDHCYAWRWNLARGNGLDFHPNNRAKVDIFLDEKMLTQPMRWRLPHTVFPCSMSDLFGEFVSDAWLDRVFAMAALTPQHTYIITTKRSARMRAYMSDISLARCDGRGTAVVELARKYHPDPDSVLYLELLRWPLPNVWLGVSVCDGGKADLAFMDDLVHTPAALRWVSYEPALAWFDLEPYAPHLKQIVFGGESGSTRRCDVDWSYRTLDICRRHGIAFFNKQLGRRPIVNGQPVKLLSAKGKDMAEWPEDLRVREFPA